jgi:hypothetical protein
MLGFLKFLDGDLTGARADLERALADYDERRDESLRTVFALDLRSNALAHLGYTVWCLGDSGEAERLTDEAIRRAKDAGQPGSYANPLVNRLAVGVRQRNRNRRSSADPCAAHPTAASICMAATIACRTARDPVQGASDSKLAPWRMLRVVEGFACPSLIRYLWRAIVLPMRLPVFEGHGDPEASNAER